MGGEVLNATESLFDLDEATVAPLIGAEDVQLEPVAHLRSTSTTTTLTMTAAITSAQASVVALVNTTTTFGFLSTSSSSTQLINEDVLSGADSQFTALSMIIRFGSFAVVL